MNLEELVRNLVAEARTRDGVTAPTVLVGIAVADRTELILASFRRIIAELRDDGITNVALIATDACLDKPLANPEDRDLLHALVRYLAMYPKPYTSDELRQLIHVGDSYDGAMPDAVKDRYIADLRALASRLDAEVALLQQCTPPSL